MSAQNVEVVREAFRAWTSGDGRAVRSLVHDDLEFHAGADHPEVEVIRRPESVEQFFQDWASTFADMRAEPVEFLDLGDWVGVELHLVGRLQDSEAEVTHDETHVFRVRDGRIAEIRDFPSREAALEFVGAAGASESPPG